MYFEECADNWKATTKGRTVSEGDIVTFSTMTGAYNSLFLNEEVAKKTDFGGRIAPGLLTASIATGLVYLLPQSPFEGGFIALVGLNMKAKKRVRIGDTLTCSMHVGEKKERTENGIVHLISDVLNQSGESVMEIEHIILVQKKKEK